MRRAALLLAAGIVPAAAQTATEHAVEQGRADRQDDYKAIGVALGAFRLFPALDLGVFHTSNVFRTAGDAESDTYFTIAPAVTLISEWVRHELKLSAGAEIRSYADLSSEDRTDWRVKAEGRIDVTRPLRIMLNAGYDVRHEERGAPDAPGNAAAPTEYAVAGAGITVDYRSGRYGLRAEATYSRFDWEPTALNGLPDRSNADRNRDEISGQITALYEFSPGYAAFLRATAGSRSFDLEADRDGADRDMTRIGAEAGVAFEMTTLLIGEVYAGYREYAFDDALFSDVESFSYGGALRWYPTELTTLRFKASRALEPSTLLGVSGVMTTSYHAEVEHELLRNLILVGSAEFTREEFEGSVRDDDTTRLGLEAKYFISREAALTAGADLVERDSTLPSAAYDETLFGVTAGLKF